MTKSMLVAQLAHEMGISKRMSLEVTNTFFDLMIQAIQEQGVLSIAGFGKFKASKRKARQGVNPQNPSEKITIPAMRVVTFKAGKDLKEAAR